MSHTSSLLPQVWVSLLKRLKHLIRSFIKPGLQVCVCLGVSTIRVIELHLWVCVGVWLHPSCQQTVEHSYQEAEVTHLSVCCCFLVFVSLSGLFTPRSSVKHRHGVESKLNLTKLPGGSGSQDPAGCMTMWPCNYYNLKREVRGQALISMQEWKVEEAETLFIIRWSLIDVETFEWVWDCVWDWDLVCWWMLSPGCKSYLLTSLSVLFSGLLYVTLSATSLVDPPLVFWHLTKPIFQVLLSLHCECLIWDKWIFSPLLTQ